MIDWKKCQHQFPAQHETVREPTFGVAYGSRRICAICRAIEYEDWCETRASGGTPRIFPPEESPATMGGTQTTTQEPPMEHSPKVSVRFSAKLYAACKKAAIAAGEKSIGTWVRKLAEEATGIEAEFIRGLDAVSEERRQEIASMGGAAKAANAKKQARKKK